MYIERILESKILPYLNKREIIAVIGPRQSGKTTLIKNILSKIKNARVNFVSFDDIEALEIFSNDIKSFVKLYVENYDYVFIDEVQYATESGKKLKYIYDFTKAKLFISGSSSAEISIKSLKYLVGRIFIFELLPFSFGEFLYAKDKKLHEIYVSKRFGKEINEKLNGLIREFIIFGGYPRVVLSETDEEKITVLKNIYGTLVLHEARDLLGLSDLDKFTKLIKALSLQIGNLINYAELSELTGLTQPKLKKQFEMLERLYIIKRCLPYGKNKRTELIKNPKVYFIDTGLRNATLGNFTATRGDFGSLYENFVFSEFLKRGKELNYWRTKNGAEVDFVFDGVPVEIKTTPRTGKSLYSFINKYKPEEAFVVSEREEPDIKVNGTDVRFVPFAKFV